jgi:hypothetical protein
MAETTPMELDPRQELTVTVERVREAASKCGDAAVVLKTLFPEAFKPKLVRPEPGDLIETTEFPGSIFVVPSPAASDKIMGGTQYESTKDTHIGCINLDNGFWHVAPLERTTILKRPMRFVERLRQQIRIDS